jgi:hypothetical protein
MVGGSICNEHLRYFGNESVLYLLQGESIEQQKMGAGLIAF